jgi:hypothetical protein
MRDLFSAADALREQQLANISVLSVAPARAGRLFALASVESEIGGVAIELHGIRTLRLGAEGTWIELPQFRDAAGLLRPMVKLSPEIYPPIADAVLDVLAERGLAERRFAAGTTNPAAA